MGLYIWILWPRQKKWQARIRLRGTNRKCELELSALFGHSVIPLFPTVSLIRCPYYIYNASLYILATFNEGNLLDRHWSSINLRYANTRIGTQNRRCSCLRIRYVYFNPEGYSITMEFRNSKIMVPIKFLKMFTCKCVITPVRVCVCFS